MQSPENFEVFACYLTPESTFGNNRHLFHQGIGSLEICIFNIPSLISSLAISSMDRSAAPETKSPEHFEGFACYLPPESTFGNKGQLFHQVIGNIKICICNILSAPWPSVPLVAWIGGTAPGKFDVFARYFIKLLKRPAAPQAIFLLKILYFQAIFKHFWNFCLNKVHFQFFFKK